MVANTPLQCARNFLPQRFGLRQLANEIQFSSQTNRFDPRTRFFVVLADAPLFQPCMGRFMNDSGCDLLGRRRFKENETLIEDASL
jgi:hypothetical protein